MPFSNSILLWFIEHNSRWQFQIQRHSIPHVEQKEKNGRWWNYSNAAETYANGLNAVSQNQLLPISGTVIVRTSATLARLIQVQKVRSAAWLRLGTIVPSNLNIRLWDDSEIHFFSTIHSWCKIEFLFFSWNWRGTIKQAKSFNLSSFELDNSVWGKRRKEKIFNIASLLLPRVNSAAMEAIAQFQCRFLHLKHKTAGKRERRDMHIVIDKNVVVLGDLRNGLSSI